MGSTGPSKSSQDGVILMARRKDGQMNNSNLVVNPGSSQTGMANAPHPDSGR